MCFFVVIGLLILVDVPLSQASRRNARLSQQAGGAAIPQPTFIRASARGLAPLAGRAVVLPLDRTAVIGKDARARRLRANVVAELGPGAGRGSAEVSLAPPARSSDWNNAERSLLDILERTSQSDPEVIGSNKIASSDSASVTAILNYLEAAKPPSDVFDKRALVGDWHLEIDSLWKPVREDLTSVDGTGMSVAMSISDVGAMLITANISLLNGERQIVILRKKITQIGQTPRFFVTEQDGEHIHKTVSYVGDVFLVLRAQFEQYDTLVHLLDTYGISIHAPSTEVWRKIERPSHETWSKVKVMSLRRFAPQAHTAFTGQTQLYGATERLLSTAARQAEAEPVERHLFPDAVSSRRENKANLLRIANEISYGAKEDSAARARLEELVVDLEAANPVPRPLTSGLLSARWRLVYTDSSSIFGIGGTLFFGRKSSEGPVYHTLNLTTLKARHDDTTRVGWRRFRFLGFPLKRFVEADLEPVTESKVATLLRRLVLPGLWLRIPFHARGELDTTYLDEDLLITHDHHGSLFILVRDDVAKEMIGKAKDNETKRKDEQAEESEIDVDAQAQVPLRGENTEVRARPWQFWRGTAGSEQQEFWRWTSSVGWSLNFLLLAWVLYLRTAPGASDGSRPALSGSLKVTSAASSTTAMLADLVTGELKEEKDMIESDSKIMDTMNDISDQLGQLRSRVNDLFKADVEEPLAYDDAVLAAMIDDLQERIEKDQKLLRFSDEKLLALLQEKPGVLRGLSKRLYATKQEEKDRAARVSVDSSRPPPFANSEEIVVFAQQVVLPVALFVLASLLVTFLSQQFVRVATAWRREQWTKAEKARRIQLRRFQGLQRQLANAIDELSTGRFEEARDDFGNALSSLEKWFSEPTWDELFKSEAAAFWERWGPGAFRLEAKLPGIQSAPTKDRSEMRKWIVNRWFDSAQDVVKGYIMNALNAWAQDENQQPRASTPGKEMKTGLVIRIFGRWPEARNWVNIANLPLSGDWREKALRLLLPAEKDIQELPLIGPLCEAALTAVVSSQVTRVVTTSVWGSLTTDLWRRDRRRRRRQSAAGVQLWVQQPFQIGYEVVEVESQVPDDMRALALQMPVGGTPGRVVRVRPQIETTLNQLKSD